MKAFFRALLLVLIVCAPAAADTVTLKNGEKLSGTFQSVRGGKLMLKSEVLGDVSIPLDKVQSLVLEKPVVILGKDRKVVRGSAELKDSGDWVSTANGTSQTVSAANISVVLPQDVYHSMAEVPSKPWQLWKGGVNFGYSFQSGDQQARTISGLLAATRERPSDLIFTPHGRTNAGLTMLFAKAQQDGTSVSSDTISGNLREDILFTQRNFVFVFGQLDHILPEGLYLRQTTGGGLGRDMVHTNKTLFSVLGGVNYVHEKFIAGPSDRSADALAGEKLGMQMTKRFRIDHDLNFYADLDHARRYRLDTAVSATLKINNHFTANAGIIELYLNVPSPGSHRNNVAVTTGLGYTF